MVGTASWTEKTLLERGLFYPPEVKSAEERLKYYSRHFPTVEVDSTYYAIPSERNARLWAERTPAGFVFHIKAFSMLTGYSTAIKSLPRAIREILPEELKSRDQERNFLDEVVEQVSLMFQSALLPLKNANKLGFILFQFPPWFTPLPEAYPQMEKIREIFIEFNLAFEFRNWKWNTTLELRRLKNSLTSLGITYVVVDAPWIKGFRGPVMATTPVAYFRFHGRNRENWFKKGIETARRYEYLYTDQEIEEWAKRIKALCSNLEKGFVVYNNCFKDYGLKNAGTLIRYLSFMIEE